MTVQINLGLLRAFSKVAESSFQSLSSPCSNFSCSAVTCTPALARTESTTTDYHHYRSTPFFHLVSSNSATSFGGGAGGAGGGAAGAAGCSSAVLSHQQLLLPWYPSHCTSTSVANTSSVLKSMNCGDFRVAFSPADVELLLADKARQRGEPNYGTNDFSLRGVSEHRPCVVVFVCWCVGVLAVFPFLPT
jgi:hypothetical protein